MKQKRHFNMKAITALIIVTLAYASIAYAKPSADLTVVLFDTTGLPSCNVEQAAQVIAGARRQMSPAVKVRTKFIVMNHPIPVLQQYGKQQQLAQALLQWAKGQPRLRRKRVHILTPALVGPNGEWYSYEMGSSQCAKAAVSVGSCIPFNDLGQPRIIASYFAMAHGVLHGMGARHYFGEPTIMDPNALPYSVETEFLPIAKATKREVLRCLKK